MELSLTIFGTVYSFLNTETFEKNENSRKIVLFTYQVYQLTFDFILISITFNG